MTSVNSNKGMVERLSEKVSQGVDHEMNPDYWPSSRIRTYWMGQKGYQKRTSCFPGPWGLFKVGLVCLGDPDPKNNVCHNSNTLVFKICSKLFKFVSSIILFIKVFEE